MSESMRIWAMCRSCAHSIYSHWPPTIYYAVRVTQLLFMTGAHESGGWRYRRQIGFAPDDPRGGFGLWQCERGSIEDSLRYIARREALLSNCEHWLEVQGELTGHTPLVPLTTAPQDVRDILALIQTPEGDALSCLLARLHYIREPSPVPDSLTDQAAYAKQYYNTEAGAATAKLYLDAYRRWFPKSERIKQ